MTRIALAALFVALAASCTGPKGEKGGTGETGPAGPPGETGPGFMTPPSVSAVTPNRVAQSLTVDVSISGFATSWMSSAQVSFGNGITVNSVKLGSRTGLVANITVQPDAMPGTRDVKVTQGAEVTNFNGIFTILPLWEIKPVGTASRGGYWYFEIRSNDPDFAFPSATAEISVTTAPSPAMGTLTGVVSSLKPRSLVVKLHANFPVPLQMYTTTVEFAGVRLVMPTFDLADRNGLMLNDATPLMNVAMGAYESKLIQYTPAAAPVPAIIHVSGPKASRWQLILLNTDGDPVGPVTGSAGVQGPGLDIMVTGDPAGTFFVLSEVDGRSNAQVTVSAVTNMPIVNDAEPNDSRDTAQVFALVPLGGDTGVNIAGMVDDYSDPDWYKVTVPMDGVGKRLHVRAFAQAWVYWDVEVLTPTGGTMFTDYIQQKTVDFYTAPLAAEGDYAIHLEGDTTSVTYIVISLQ